MVCCWHSTKAWLEELRPKLEDKTRFREAFDMLHDIMFMRPTGPYDERLAAVTQAITDFKAAFAGEKEVVDWFKRAWEKKKGAAMKDQPMSWHVLCGTN